MTYQLGVDLGTTKTAAAVRDADQVRPVQLGNRSTAVPSVVFLRDDGVLLFGDAAARRADTEPGRSAREFKRRVGDPVPLLLAGTPFSGQQLMALTLAWVVERVTQLEGEPPATITLTHPANWGPYKRESLLKALRAADLQPAQLVPEPVAAAIHFEAGRRVAPGETVAIYDLGGGTFDAAVLRRGETDFAILGTPVGLDDVGGFEIDEAVLGHIWSAIGGPPEDVDPARVAALRRDVVEAKEQLSEDVSADVVVDLGADRRTVLLRRSELEELIRPLLERTVDSLERALVRSGVAAEAVSAVVLVGGSSRIPLVKEVLRSRLGLPIGLDSQPQLAIALGAALATSAPVLPLPPPPPLLQLPPVQQPPPAQQPSPVTAAEAVTEELPPVLAAIAIEQPIEQPIPSPRRRRPSRRTVLAGTGIVVTALVLGISAALSLPRDQGRETAVEPVVSTTSTFPGLPTAPATSRTRSQAPVPVADPTTTRTRSPRPTGVRTTVPTTTSRPTTAEPTPTKKPTRRPPRTTSAPPSPTDTAPEATAPEPTDTADDPADREDPQIASAAPVSP